ncbi:uncharacterized protein Z518_10151 [Rhinocladiella mackenziei CBS 650.93]|uniref:protein-ribulosamine 3-kinase n=1 Tax=Rhinocladiella mackenziei CBS 650.93 TaxID=1442369 RepID=A0A0D2IWU1_9EURO|nr:uncharacterized protein Z518_10151 [Rhinocladiella mackenziei CBS 650.93]KIX01085.1 hypothetical protein Z518_10151 [Rhinocladiella mackenziei CBS 650.93]
MATSPRMTLQSNGDLSSITNEIDENVQKFFPFIPNSIQLHTHGTSKSAGTFKLTIHQSSSGKTADFFLKTVPDNIGQAMIRGEFSGLNALYDIKPGIVPRPIGWGTYSSNPEIHFLLNEFVEMDDINTIEGRSEFCALLAELHKISAGRSPTGKYGFDVTTYAGIMHRDNSWCDTWEEFFFRAMRNAADQEKEVHGQSPELDELVHQLHEKVIPRLLRPLANGKNPIQPCLVHGDIWRGNVAINGRTKKPIMLDPAAFWAHHEYELGNSNVSQYILGYEWIQEYHKHMPVSEPVEDYEGRRFLYALYVTCHDRSIRTDGCSHGHFCASILNPETQRHRNR